MFQFFKKKDNTSPAWKIRGMYVGHGVSIFEDQHFEYTGTYLVRDQAMQALKEKLTAEGSRYDNVTYNYDDDGGSLSIEGKGTVLFLSLQEIKFS